MTFETAIILALLALFAFIAITERNDINGSN